MRAVFLTRLPCFGHSPAVLLEDCLLMVLMNWRKHHPQETWAQHRGQAA